MLHKRVRAAGDRAGGVLEWPAACVSLGSASFSRWHCSRSPCGRRCPCSPSGSPRSRAASIGSKIDQKRKQIDAKKGRERVLSTTITRYSRRINSLQGDITVLQRKQVAIQGDLDAKRAELARIQEDLRQERIRLARLRARLAEARIALADRLVQLYKADKPDVVTVVLESDGFADLLRAHRVHAARLRPGRAHHRPRPHRARRSQAHRGAARHARGAPDQGRRGDRGAPRRGRPRQGPARRPPRRVRRGALRQVDRARQHAREPPAPRGRPRGAGEARTRRSRPSSRPPRTARRRAPRARSSPGSGGMVWPVNGPVVSPFGMRWGRLHAGVDIAVPAGTPIRAAKSGRVILLGWTGGYGNYTCVGHGGGRLDVLRAPVALRDLQRREREPGPGHRLRRLHRPLLRRPPALRGAGRRRAGQPDGLPLADRVRLGSVAPRDQHPGLRAADVRADARARARLLGRARGAGG